MENRFFFLLKVLSLPLLLIILWCFLIACATPKTLIKVERGDLIDTSTQTLTQLWSEYEVKINWQPPLTAVEIKIFKNIFCQKKDRAFYQKVGTYKVYDPILEGEDVTFAHQMGDLLIVRPLMILLPLIALKPIWNPQGFYKTVFLTPPGYKETTHEEKISIADTSEVEARIYSEPCNSIPVRNKEVIINLWQNDYQKSYHLHTNRQGQVLIDLAHVPCLHYKTALYIEATADLDGRIVGSYFRISSDELAGLSLPEAPPWPSLQAFGHYGQGRTYRLQKMLHKAIYELEKAIDYYPNFKEALNELGRAYAAIQKFNQALYYVEESLLIDPNQKVIKDLHRDIEKKIAQMKAIKKSVEK